MDYLRYILAFMENSEWKSTHADIFWGEVAPCDHVVQIYESDGVFMDSLAGFVGGGINAGECVIVIATEVHLKALEGRLAGYGVNVESLKADDRYIPLDAEECLKKFMVDGWPDEALFIETITSVTDRGICKNRKVRAFGEMVALLWAKGMNGATVHLEHMWSRFCEQHALSLFCAYPRTGFTQNMNESILNICGCHTRMINGESNQTTEVRYKEVC